MKKYMIMLVLAMPVLAQAQGKEYVPQFDISVIGGFQHFKNMGESGALYGVGISFQCPLASGGKTKMRQQFIVSRQENEKFRSFSMEITPQFNIISRPSFEIGISPGAGIIYINANKSKSKLFTYGMGATASYNFKRLFVGVESRYSWTKKQDFPNVDKGSESPVVANLNNLRAFIRVGYKLYK